jgi:hypothetical protein
MDTVKEENLNQPVKRTRRSPKVIKEILDTYDAVKLYVEENKTSKEIEDLTGVNHASIDKYLKDHGVEMRSASRRQETRNTYPVGTKFGLWTIISDQVKVGSNRALYQLCQCCCGNTAWKSLTALRTGSTTKCKSCGNKSYLTENGEISINGMINSFYTHIINNVNKRKKVSQLEFNITPEYLEKLYEEQNHKCALSGLSLELDITKPAIQQNWSLDRINSDIGYVEGNVQWVHKDINMMKQSYSNDYFKEMCCKVAEYNGYSKCN